MGNLNQEMVPMTMIPKSFGTHDGTFHADEVTACALLLLFGLVERSQIHRTRDQELLDRCEYVCDVGGIYDPTRKLFDHHQSDYQGPLSSAGMILDHLRQQGILTDKEQAFFNDSLILGVDAHDNGQMPQHRGVCTFSHVIANFTPIKHGADDAMLMAAFSEALDFVVGHINRVWERYKYIQECGDIVEKAMAEGGECLYFDQSIPWVETFFEKGGINHPAVFLIMPAGEHWKLRAIPPTYEDRMSVRVPLPEQWAGLLEGELVKVSGIPGAIFCHKQRFISIWETKEDAVKALEYTLKMQKERR